MLANLLHKFMASQAVVETTDSNNWRDYLVAGDTAQFAAGALYALSGQYIDERDYIVGCSKWLAELDYQMQEGYVAYTEENWDRANNMIKNSEPYWEDSMVDCSRTNPYFD